MRLGVHCSIRSGYETALKEAQELKCDCLQIFTHSPRIWKIKLPDDEVIFKFREKRKILKLTPLVVHTPYLLNLTSKDEMVINKSKKMLTTELVLSEKFSAEYLVMHPGVYSDSSEDHIDIFVKNLDFCLEKFLNIYPKTKLMLLLETVCGKGKKIGKSFEDFCRILTKSKFSKYIGICIDTAHVFSCGYDLSIEDGIEKMIQDIKYYIGIEKLRLLHLNDSKSPCGSQIDRHQHIGKGYIGVKGFKYLLNHKELRSLAGILETPKETEFNKISKKDKENLAILRKLIK